MKSQPPTNSKERLNNQKDYGTESSSGSNFSYSESGERIGRGQGALIQVQNLCKTYDNEGVKTAAMCGASFVIGKGEFVSIMGPSGSGKSTLMQILGMLDRPTEGKYFFEGKDTFGFDDDTLAGIRNKKIGFVFQSFNLLPRTSVYENVELPLLYDSKPDGQNRKKVMDALLAVGMEHREKYLSNQLSGGEKQRVAIARALVNNPDVVFADEPTGNLDSKSGLQVMKILQKLNNDGHTIILVTHETYTAEHAERILYMKDGQIVADDPVRNRRMADGESELLK
ncbi:MAG: Macrolide transporter ATP-binding protein [Patescibacteria group bacterium]|nr:Macrolide transporter ATP-binding protein [Patescibacteria group bacterium]